MKKFLFIVLLFLIPFCGFSQTKKPIDGFLGITFGSDSATVKAAIIAKGGSENLRRSIPDQITFDNVTLGTMKVDLCVVKFINNKAFEAQFAFLPRPESDIINLYNKLSEDLNEVYGLGYIYKTFTPPNQEGDGFEIMALKSGHAIYKTVWKSSNKNGIGLQIQTHPLASFIIYQDDALVIEAIKRDKEKQTKDF